MRAAEQYQRARQHGLTFEGACHQITLPEWERLMEGAVVANKRVITQILREQGHENPDILKWGNPYQSYRTKTHLVWVHSAIEHFYRIN